jgi:hypothetical protein
MRLSMPLPGLERSHGPLILCFLLAHLQDAGTRGFAEFFGAFLKDCRRDHMRPAH